ncbi:unnamed protein product [Phyllotreta striolata]|uniref:RCC1-like domain-containing protein n=1 Tax=Phyllotreta striolata TaxID=444603 RepID=A0A9N9TFN8_PHYSR|nr:unnamed protein product [Phyllotreta striolata]
MNKLERFACTLSKCNKRYISGPKRKYPIDREHEKTLPVFQYNVSKENYRRVFSWGNIHTGALGKGFKKYKEGEKYLKPLYFPKRITLGEQHEVVSATCGFGFTVFSVRNDTSQKLYGTGINTDSQIGYHEVRTGHPLETIFVPQPIHLPFKNPESARVTKLAAGRAHLLVLTDEGLFTLGNNSFGQCGRRVVPDENYGMSNYIHHIENIDGKKIVDVECGQDHSLAVTEDGGVYSCGWGADGQTGLEHYKNCSEFTKVNGDISSEKIVKVSSKSDFVMALNDKGEVFGWGNTEYGQITLPGGDQQISTPHHIKMLDKLGKIKCVATAGAFCLVVNENGQVYSWGYGLLGTGPNVELSKTPVHIPQTLFGRNDFQPDSTVIDVTCGLYHAAAITNLGDLYTWGRNKFGCLGLGDIEDQYFPLKVAIGGIVQKVACGIDHTVAVCKPFI